MNSYNVPGIHIEENSIEVPLSWEDLDPRDLREVRKAKKMESLSFFYRVLTAPEHVNDQLPLLLFLQGGPGGKSPRPISVSSDGWFKEALKHFSIILPDQRGTGKSSPVTGETILSRGTPQEQSDFLHHFLADSIVKDCEYLRQEVFSGRKWATLGQSYGGFLTLTYLSFYPEAINVSFTTGGIPSVPANVHEVYEHTWNKVHMKNDLYFSRYPSDRERFDDIAESVEKEKPHLPNGDLLTLHRLQDLGNSFGMKPSFEKIHFLLEDAFDSAHHLTPGFLNAVMNATSTYGRELYWVLQEGIYMDGGEEGSISCPHWAAWEEMKKRPEFASSHRPLLFTGEMTFPWRFEECSELKPFREAMNIFMASTQWGHIYDEKQLQKNKVPLLAAVYHNDMYVPSELSLATLQHVRNSTSWVTSSYEHDGLHEEGVFTHLFNLALSTGALCHIEEETATNKGEHKKLLGR